MILQFPSKEPFATGSITYTYAPATPQDVTNRIQLPIVVTMDSSFETLAVLDTGAPYMILDPTIAETIGFRPEQSLGQISMQIRGQKMPGSLVRLNISLEAQQGQDLTVEATTFIPNLKEQWGNFPSFLGLSGFLERIRFAIDPLTNTFYFGSL